MAEPLNNAPLIAVEDGYGGRTLIYPPTNPVIVNPTIPNPEDTFAVQTQNNEQYRASFEALQNRGAAAQVQETRDYASQQTQSEPVVSRESAKQPEESRQDTTTQKTENEPRRTENQQTDDAQRQTQEDKRSEQKQPQENKQSEEDKKPREDKKQEPQNTRDDRQQQEQERQRDEQQRQEEQRRQEEENKRIDEQNRQAEQRRYEEDKRREEQRSRDEWEYYEQQRKAAEARQAKPASDYRSEYGSAGVGGGIVLGTALLAALPAAVTMLSIGMTFTTLAAVGVGLAALGGTLFVAQQVKKSINHHHAAQAWHKRAGYHHEPEYLKDKSLIGSIQGKSDIPERVEYIEKTYGMDVMKPGEFRRKHGGIGIIGGVLTAAVAAVAVSLVIPSLFMGAALALSATLGVLAGGTGMAVHNAHVANQYDKYVDDMAKSGEANLRRQQAAQQQAEYENGKGRRRTHVAELEAARQQCPPAPCR